MSWSFHPLAFMELLVVLAFGVGWWILERHANRIDARRRPEEDDNEPPRPAAPE